MHVTPYSNIHEPAQLESTSNPKELNIIIGCIYNHP